MPHIEKFYKDKPVYARTHFTYNGTEYAPGDKFEQSDYHTRRMWVAYRLTHKTTEQRISSGVQIENMGAGWYNIEIAGVTMNPEKIRGKDAAIEWAVENLGVSKDEFIV